MSQVGIVKDAIAESFKELMRRMPFEKISIVDICEQSGISRRSFYRYFSDKYELLQWIYEHEYLRGSVYNDDWVIWDDLPSICEYFYSDRKFYLNAFKVAGQNSFREYCHKLLKPLIYRDFEGVFSDERDADFFIEHLAEMFFDGFVLWLGREPCEPPEKFAAGCRRWAAAVAQRVADNASRETRE